MTTLSPVSKPVQYTTLDRDQEFTALAGAICDAALRLVAIEEEIKILIDAQDALSYYVATVRIPIREPYDPFADEDEDYTPPPVNPTYEAARERWFAAKREAIRAVPSLKDYLI